MPENIKKSLSIVIPAHNEERLLRGCLEAIANQTVAPDQVIVVDNNSTDRTAEIAASFPFVTVVHEPQQGIVYARNRGFGCSTSDIIGRIDADSILPPTWVATIKDYYDDPAHDRYVLNGGCRFYNLHSGRLTGFMYDLVVHRVNRFILGYHFPWGSNSALPATLWREVEDKICLQTDIHEDLDLGIHLHYAGATVQYWPRMRVGAVARRIMDQRGMLRVYLRMYILTMRQHRVTLWPLCVPISFGIWLFSYVIFVTEFLWNKIGQPKKL